MQERTRIALSTGLLRVPPTYFALQHAEALRADFDFRMHAVGAEIRDPALSIRVLSGTRQGLPWPAVLAASIMATPLMQNRQRVLIEQFAPAVIHQHFATWAGGPLDAAARMGVPVVTTLHGYDVFAARGKSTGLLAARHRRSARRSAAESVLLLAVSEYLAGEAIDAGFPADRIAVHYQGVDSDYFTPPENSGSRRAPHIVFVGALETRKGVDDLITLSDRLVGTGLRLRVIGAGSRRAELAAAASSTGVIDLLGSVDRHRIRDELRNARTLVLPTREHGGWREAAGLVLLEAQSCGTPVVTYASGGAPEMVADGQSGVVVPERDADAFADAAIQLSSLDVGEHRMWADAARSFVVEKRSLASSARGLAQHYRRLALGAPA